MLVWPTPFLKPAELFAPGVQPPSLKALYQLHTLPDAAEARRRLRALVAEQHEAARAEAVHQHADEGSGGLAVAKAQAADPHHPERHQRHEEDVAVLLVLAGDEIDVGPGVPGGG